MQIERNTYIHLCSVTGTMSVQQKTYFPIQISKPKSITTRQCSLCSMKKDVNPCMS